ncbi:hypothetical protein [Stappia taiwanensis]|nr:hypothetical protein [Stappia taiwanensis]
MKATLLICASLIAVYGRPNTKRIGVRSDLAIFKKDLRERA